MILIKTSNNISSSFSKQSNYKKIVHYREKQVEERTNELVKTNEQLKKQIVENVSRQRKP